MAGAFRAMLEQVAARNETKAVLPALRDDATGSSPDAIRAATAEAVRAMETAARDAGLQPGEPMAPLLASLQRLVTAVGQLTAENAHIAAEQHDRNAEVQRKAQLLADSQAASFEVRLQTAQAETVRDIASAIVQHADRAFTRRVRVLDRNTALLAAGILFGATLAALGGGYWWGSANALASVQQTEQGLRQAFREGPDDAATWLSLMTWNPINEATKNCRPVIQNGRHACWVGLWTEPPKPPP